MQRHIKDGIVSPDTLLKTISQLRAHLAEAWEINESLVQENCTLRIALVESQNQQKERPAKAVSGESSIQSQSEPRKSSPFSAVKSTIPAPSTTRIRDSSDDESDHLAPDLPALNSNIAKINDETLESTKQMRAGRYSPEYLSQYEVASSTVDDNSIQTAWPTEAAQEMANLESPVRASPEPSSEDESAQPDGSDLPYRLSSSGAESDTAVPEAPRPGSRVFSWGKPIHPQRPEPKSSANWKSQVDQQNSKSPIQKVIDSSLSDISAGLSFSAPDDAQEYNNASINASARPVSREKPLSNAHSDRVSFGSPEAPKQGSGRFGKNESLEESSLNIQSPVRELQAREAEQNSIQAGSQMEAENAHANTTIADESARSLRREETAFSRPNKSYATLPPSLQNKDSTMHQALAQLSATSFSFTKPTQMRQAPVFEEPSQDRAIHDTTPAKTSIDTSSKTDNMISASSQLRPPRFSELAFGEETDHIPKFAKTSKTRKRPALQRHGKTAQTDLGPQLDVSMETRVQSDKARSALSVRPRNLPAPVRKEGVSKPLPGSPRISSRSQSTRRKLTRAYEKVDDASIVGFSSESQADISTKPSRGSSRFVV